MSLALPGLRRREARHSADGQLRATQRQLAACQAGNAAQLNWRKAADVYFEQLLADRADVYAAWQQATQRAAEAEMVAVCAQADLDDMTAERDQLAAENTALRAQLANAQALTVPAAHRDIDPDDQPTDPIGVRVTTLWDALNAHGPVIPVAPIAMVPGDADPAGIPSSVARSTAGEVA
ncbi:hypothetical protein [Streptomyces sp. NPDC059994]|uniref:hypothetical protein n=1 Tax=Streptomyces sp. NPDC059994 TaxID=3347029 RepID=UPI0036C4ED76